MREGLNVTAIARGSFARRTLQMVLALVLAFGLVIVGKPGLAHAQQYVCGTQSEIVTGNPGDIVYKAPPGCHDFNLTGTYSYDGYEGRYWDGTGWQWAYNGMHWVNGDFSGDIVLLSNMSTGVPMYAMDGGIYCLGNGCQDNFSVWVDY